MRDLRNIIIGIVIAVIAFYGVTKYLEYQREKDFYNHMKDIKKQADKIIIEEGPLTPFHW